MNAILYIIIFIVGALIGSFCALAVYRIPRKIDIVKTQSFCPNCEHKLGFLELIPVFSYIFLRGKCKHCNEKINPTCFIFEILSGLILVLIAVSIKLTVSTLNINLFIELVFLALYLIAIFLIAGIDKDNKVIEKNVIYYALAILTIYIIYLCIIDINSIYRYVMYLAIILVLLVIDTLKLKNKAKNSYTLLVLILVMIMAVFTGEAATIASIFATLLIVIFTSLFDKIENKISKIKREKEFFKDNLTMGYYLSVSNVVMLIVVLFINNWILL